MSRPITVLIVEDNPDDFFFLKETLMVSEDFDAVVAHEERLESALAAAAISPVDVAIIDLSLPDSFGLDTFVRFHEKFPSIPVVIMTHAKDYDMALNAVRQGAQDYIIKGEPSPSAITRIVRYAIERQRLTTELRSALERVRQLERILPICSSCKKIRDEEGYWNRIESYISRYVNVEFSHGVCPECAEKLYSEFLVDKK